MRANVAITAGGNLSAARAPSGNSASAAAAASSAVRTTSSLPPERVARASTSAGASAFFTSTVTAIDQSALRSYEPPTIHFAGAPVPRAKITAPPSNRSGGACSPNRSASNAGKP